MDGLKWVRGAKLEINKKSNFVNFAIFGWKCLVPGFQTKQADFVRTVI